MDILNHQDYASLNFQQKRREFLNFLMRICRYKIKRYTKKDQYKTTWYNSYPEFQVTIIKSETEETAPEYFDTYKFNPEWNNRDILLSEAVLELESDDFLLNMFATIDTCKNLMKEKIHFYIFYAEGMRTWHIHIYDFFPLVQDWAEKEMAMNLFANKIVSLEYRHLLDRNLFGQHRISLEFAKHYRTGHIKKLIFEYRPEEVQL